MIPALSILRMNRRRKRALLQSQVNKTFSVSVPFVPSEGFQDFDDILAIRKFLPVGRLVILNNSTDAQTVVYVRFNATQANDETPDTYTVRALGLLDVANSGANNFAWSASRLDGGELTEPFTLNVTAYTN